MSTTIAVERVGARHVARLTHGLLRAQVLNATAERCRVGLLATSALLLGGDVVELDVEVGPGARLDLVDVAGTVAYHGRGAPSAWTVRCTLGPDARLTYAGEPFVVADGADVTRTCTLDLARGASAVLRDTLVLGRSGQVGGRVRSRSEVRVAERPVLLEDQLLDPDRLRRAPGLLGPHRVVDTLTRVGLPADPCTEAATTYALVDGSGTLTRWLGSSLADSPLHSVDVGRPDLDQSTASTR